MWFVMATLSIVGYGDVTSHASIGKFLACFQILVGLCYIATPLAIVCHSFSDTWSDRFHLLLFHKFAHGAIQRENSMTLPYSTLSCLRSQDFFEHLSASEIIDELVPTAACSLNLLLNIGPTETIPPAQRRCLASGGNPSDATPGSEDQKHFDRQASEGYPFDRQASEGRSFDNRASEGNPFDVWWSEGQLQ